jgi:hypothetical protein
MVLWRNHNCDREPLLKTLVHITYHLIQIFSSSNMHKLREFIKHVYVDRKYTGERSQENLPRIKLVYIFTHTILFILDFWHLEVTLNRLIWDESGLNRCLFSSFTRLEPDTLFLRGTNSDWKWVLFGVFEYRMTKRSPMRSRRVVHFD